MNKTQCEKGYRFLKDNELLQIGDEHNYKDFRGSWLPVEIVDVGQHASNYSYLAFRRKVEKKEPQYRVLGKDEVIKKGDQVGFRNERYGEELITIWDQAVGAIGQTCNKNCYTAPMEARRRIHGTRPVKTPKIKTEPPKVDLPKPAFDPGPGYRLLNKGESLLASDECWVDLTFSNGWIFTNCPGQKVGNIFANGDYYRRKIEEPKTTVDPGVGYRLLSKNEDLVATDECFCSGNWAQTRDAELNTRSRKYGVNTLYYRRKIEGPTASKETFYRLLNKGEQVQEGDEYWTPDSSSWEKTECIGLKVSAPDKGDLYRRKITGKS
jgi:hypothetical protein